MNNLPLISIIVPIYNCAPYLREAINSIISQTYQNVEIILIDDGSTDESYAICKGYEEKDERINAIHTENRGVSYARNLGLNMIKGQFVTFVDSDDYIDNSLIEKMVVTAINQNVDIVTCGFKFVGEEPNTHMKDQFKSDQLLSGIQVTKLLLEDKAPYNFSWGKLYKASLFENIRFPLDRHYEDTATIYRVTAKAGKIICLKDKLYNYRISRPGNITSELKSEKALSNYIDGCTNCIERMRFCETYPEYSDMEKYNIQFLCRWCLLGLQKATYFNKTIYKSYFSRILEIISKSNIKHYPRKLSFILKYPYIYYYIYPILSNNKTIKF